MAAPYALLAGLAVTVSIPFTVSVPSTKLRSYLLEESVPAAAVIV